MSKVSVKDSVVFVTGVSQKRGIGQALVEEALQRGAKKVYATARKISQLDELAAKFPDKVVAIELDVTSPEQIQRAAQEASDTQVLINNAGVCGFVGCIYGYDEKVAREEMEVNYFGPLYLMRSFSESLMRNGNGAIVNVISIGGLMPFPVAATYSASKAALYSLTQAARIELMPQGIPVFGVYPGPIDTRQAEQLPVRKESPVNAACHILDGMEQGVYDITPDPLSRYFQSFLEKDPEVMEAIKREFGQGNYHSS